MEEAEIDVCVSTGTCTGAEDCASVRMDCSVVCKVGACATGSGPKLGMMGSICGPVFSPG